MQIRVRKHGFWCILCTFCVFYVCREITPSHRSFSVGRLHIVLQKHFLQLFFTSGICSGGTCFEGDLLRLVLEPMLSFFFKLVGLHSMMFAPSDPAGWRMKFQIYIVGLESFFCGIETLLLLSSNIYSLSTLTPATIHAHPCVADTNIL
jgi:hypothetical protein